MKTTEIIQQNQSEVKPFIPEVTNIFQPLDNEPELTELKNRLGGTFCNHRDEHIALTFLQVYPFILREYVPHIPYFDNYGILAGREAINKENVSGTFEHGVFTDIYQVDFKSAYPHIILALTDYPKLEILLKLRFSADNKPLSDAIKKFLVCIYGQLKKVDENLRRAVTRRGSIAITALIDHIGVKPIVVMTDGGYFRYTKKLDTLTSFHDIPVKIDKLNFAIVKDMNNRYVEFANGKIEYKGATFKHASIERDAVIASFKGLPLPCELYNKREVARQIECIKNGKDIPDKQFFYAEGVKTATDEQLIKWIDSRHFGNYLLPALQIMKKSSIQIDEYGNYYCPVTKGLASIGGLGFGTQKRNWSGTKLNSITLQAETSDYIVVESYSNALALALHGYSSICIFGVTELNHIPKDVIYSLWLDLDAEKTQQGHCKKHNVKGVWFTDELRINNNMDVNDILTFDNSSDIIHQLVKSASVLCPKKEIAAIEVPKVKKAKTTVNSIVSDSEKVNYNLAQMDKIEWDLIGDENNSRYFQLSECPVRNHSTVGNFRIYIDLVTGTPSVHCFKDSCIKDRITKPYIYYNAVGLSNLWYGDRRLKKSFNQSGQIVSELEPMHQSEIDRYLNEINEVIREYDTEASNTLSLALGDLSNNAICLAQTGAGKSYNKNLKASQKLIAQIQAAIALEEDAETIKSIFDNSMCSYETPNYKEVRAINQQRLDTLFPDKITIFNCDNDKVCSDMEEIKGHLVKAGFQDYLFLIGRHDRQNQLSKSNVDEYVKRLVICVTNTSYLAFNGDTGMIFRISSTLCRDRIVIIDELGIFLASCTASYNLDYHCVMVSEDAKGNLYNMAKGCNMYGNGGKGCQACRILNSKGLDNLRLVECAGLLKYKRMKGISEDEIQIFDNISDESKDKLSSHMNDLLYEYQATELSESLTTTYSESLELPKPENQEERIIDILKDRVNGRIQDFKTRIRYLVNPYIWTKFAKRGDAVLNRQQLHDLYSSGVKLKRGELSRTKTDPCCIRNVKGFNSLPFALLKLCKNHIFMTATLSNQDVEDLRSVGIDTPITTITCKPVAQFRPQLFIDTNNISHEVINKVLDKILDAQEGIEILNVFGNKKKALDAFLHAKVKHLNVYNRSNITSGSLLESGYAKGNKTGLIRVTFSFRGSPHLYGTDLIKLNVIFIDALNFKPRKAYRYPLSLNHNSHDAYVKFIAASFNDSISQIVGRGFRTAKENIVAGQTFADNKPYIIYLYNCRYPFLQNYKLDTLMCLPDTPETIHNPCGLSNKVTADRLFKVINAAIKREDVQAIKDTFDNSDVKHLKKADSVRYVPEQIKDKVIAERKRDKAKIDKARKLELLKEQIVEFHQQGLKWVGLSGIKYSIHFDRLDKNQQKILTAFYHRIC